MDELRLFSLLQGIDEKLEKNNQLLNEVISKLNDIESEASSVSSNTDYTYNVKNVAEDILDFLKENLN